MLLFVNLNTDSRHLADLYCTLFSLSNHAVYANLIQCELPNQWDSVQKLVCKKAEYDYLISVVWGFTLDLGSQDIIWTENGDQAQTYFSTLGAGLVICNAWHWGDINFWSTRRGDEEGGKPYARDCHLKCANSNLMHAIILCLLPFNLMYVSGYIIYA